MFVLFKRLFNVKKKINKIKVEPKPPTIVDLEKFIYYWNTQSPIDRYYRQKYNLRFNSPEHRALCLIDMAIEYYEDKLFEYKENDYKPGKGEFLKERKQELPTDDQLIEMFSNQDLSFLDDKESGR